MKLFKKIFGGEGSNYKFKTTVFLICLSASSIIWLLSKLSETYNSQINIPIQYENLPQGKILIGESDSSVNITLNDQGFKLIWIKYFNTNRSFTISLTDVDLSTHDNRYQARISTTEWTDEFLNRFNLAGQVINIRPDSVGFTFEDRFYKKVPLVPEISVNFRRQFFAYDSLQIMPDSVVISGLEADISTIESIKTSPVVYNDVSSSINTSVQLQVPQNVVLEDLPARRVNLMLGVEKFTEAKVNIPIGSVNSPANMRVRIFPEEVAVSYIVAVKDYKSITPDMFQMQVDLSNINLQGAKKLQVTPAVFPQTV